MTISLRPGGLGAEAPALVFRPARRATVLCGRVGDCCREDCPFHSARRRPGLCCSHAGEPACRSGLSKAGRATGPCPRFREAPRSMQLGLSSSVVRQRSPYPHRSRKPYARRDIIPKPRRRRKLWAQKSAEGGRTPPAADGGGWDARMGSGAGTRTPTLSSKGWCPTIRRPPSA